MKLIKKLKAFTLVELIIVITILAILATIAFVSFQNYTKDARDSNRLATLKNIENGLNTFQITTGNYPEPDIKTTIYLSGTKVSYQGEIGNNVTSLIKLSETPKDPQNSLPYYYATSDAGKGYKLLTYLENTQANIIHQTYATQNTPIVRGIGPAILSDSENNVIKTDVDLFGSQSGTSYKVLVDNTTQTTGSGIDIGGGFQMMAVKGGDFPAPKSCPDGFIPVPGNRDFMQPGFCVAKYEMALERDLMSSELNVSPSRNTWTGTLNTKSTGSVWEEGKIVSAPGKYTITKITQIQAIAACNTIGSHLITNNERMTIARNIENVNENWSTQIVGSGYIYNGLTKSDLGCGIVNSKVNYPDLPYQLGAKTGPGGNVDCDNKRQLKISNGEKIWDFAGNVREHVNKANTINGGLYNKGKLKIDNNQANWVVYNTGLVTEFYGRHKNGWNGITIPDDFRKKFGSVNSSYGTGQGIGSIYGWFTNDIQYPHNIYFRGGSADHSVNSGIYSLYLHWDETSNNIIVGFRCTY